MRIVPILIGGALSLAIVFNFAIKSFQFSKVIAVESQIIITEIMYNPEGSDSKREWVEIYNNTNSGFDLKNWKFNDGSNHNLVFETKDGGELSYLEPSEYAILASDTNSFRADYPDFSKIVIDTTMTLTNTGKTLKIIDNTGLVVDSFNYPADLSPEGSTLEWNNDDFWHSSLINGGTPGEGDSLEKFLKEKKSGNFLKLLSPADGKGITDKEIDFSWEDNFSCSSCQYNLLVSQDQNFSNLLINQITTENDLSAKLDLGDYFWKIIRIVKIFNGIEEKNLVLEESDQWQFSVLSAAAETSGPVNSEPIEISTGEASNYLNYLVKVNGTVVANYATVFYLDDGSGRLKIYFPRAANFDKSNVKKGFEVSVAGVIEKYEQTFRLIPRSQEDLQVLSITSASSTKASKTTNTTSGAKPSAVISNSSQTNLLNQGIVRGVSFSALQKTQGLIQSIEKGLILALIFLGLIFVEWRWSILATAKHKPEKLPDNLP